VLEGSSSIAFSAGLFPDGDINLNSARSRLVGPGFPLVSHALGSSYANSRSRSKTSRMNTYIKYARNTLVMNTYANSLFASLLERTLTQKQGEGALRAASLPTG
jgi:hypothetical protein